MVFLRNADADCRKLRLPNTLRLMIAGDVLALHSDLDGRRKEFCALWSDNMSML